jgi:ubiquinone/menaquinone biosynthesis C-methylase UbiE
VVTVADEAGTDLGVLRSKAYATPDKLGDRAAIYAHRQSSEDLRSWAVSRADWSPDGLVLDLGCGPGVHAARLRSLRPDLGVVGADLSLGMLAAARAADAGIRPVVVDAARLPFDVASFDGVMANHMLYHVADQDAAVAEVRRVLVDGGSFVAVTNAVDHFAEFTALMREATGRERRRISERFSTDTGGEVLSRHFDEVVLHELVDELVVPEAGPIVRYARSARDLSGSGATDEQWERAMLALERVVEAHLEADGPIHITTHTGAFVCR